MANLRNRKVSKFLTPYVEAILDREKIDYAITNGGDCNLFEVEVTSSKFSEVIEDALCLEESKRLYNNEFLVVTKKTIRNKKKLKRINPTHKHVILREKDQ